MSHPVGTLTDMDITKLPLESELDTALHDLEEAGLEFSVVCEGPEPACPARSIPQAA